MISGTVTHPKDLQPAIDALTTKGRMYLRELAQGQEPQPWMIAKAADYEREHGKP